MATHYIIIKLNKNVVCFPHSFIRCDSDGCALLVKKILQVHKLWKWSCLLEVTPPEPEKDMVGAGGAVPNTEYFTVTNYCKYFLKEIIQQLVF